MRSMTTNLGTHTHVTNPPMLHSLQAYESLTLGACTPRLDKGPHFGHGDVTKLFTLRTSDVVSIYMTFLR